MSDDQEASLSERKQTCWTDQKQTVDTVTSEQDCNCQSTNRNTGEEDSYRYVTISGRGRTNKFQCQDNGKTGLKVEEEDLRIRGDSTDDSQRCVFAEEIANFERKSSSHASTTNAVSNDTKELSEIPFPCKNQTEYATKIYPTNNTSKDRADSITKDNCGVDSAKSSSTNHVTKTCPEKPLAKKETSSAAEIEQVILNNDLKKNLKVECPPTEVQLEVNTSTSADLTKERGRVKKGVLARLALLKLWLVLLLTLGFSLVLLVASHLTHSLTLRIEAYHALYNLLALGGCIITIKVCQGHLDIKNTFGWARLELLSCLFSLVFITSLCFSVTLESMQTAAHADHQDSMHHPLPVIALGGIGLCLNALVFCLIGGYTHHQGCFLERRGNDVWIHRHVPQDAAQAGMRTLSNFQLREIADSPLPRSYEGIKGILRDTIGLVLVILCASIVYWDDGDSVALYTDPVFAVISASILLVLSYPYGKECCQILLQTIPGHINVHSLSESLLQEFPEVVSVHHLHIWSLTPGKVIATAHVVYSSPKVFRKNYQSLKQFFLEKDITQVTLQPEFLHFSDSISSQGGNSECLLRCTNNLCSQKECCQLLQADLDIKVQDDKRRKSDEETKISSSGDQALSSDTSLETGLNVDHGLTIACKSLTIDLTFQEKTLQQKLDRHGTDITFPISRALPNLDRSKSQSCHLQVEKEERIRSSFISLRGENSRAKEHNYRVKI